MKFWLSLLLIVLCSSDSYGSQMTICKRSNSTNDASVKEQCAGPTVFLKGNVGPKGEKGDPANEAKIEKNQESISELKTLFRSEIGNLNKMVQSCANNCILNTHKCDANAKCTNTATNYTCACNPGYVGNGKSCKECKQPLGMENREIPNSRITASSFWGIHHESYQARLNNKWSKNSIGAWIPGGKWHSEYHVTFKPPGSEWIQVQLVQRQYVTGIITQGRSKDYAQFVTSYNIKYSDDGVNFKSIPKTFLGNTDSNTPVTNIFPEAILTSYIRLYPITWNFTPTLRMELLGCRQ